MRCPVCGQKNVLGVDTCARCGVTLRVVTDGLSGFGSQVVDLGILEDDEQQGERSDHPHAESSSNPDSGSEQKTDR